MKKTCITTDCISNLPDALIHHIYSFMDMKLVIQTSILSNRWKHLWKSTPTLNFHLNYFTLNKNPNEISFEHFVDRVFHLRDACRIQKFSLTSHQKIKAGHISTWIYVAKVRNVEELHLCLVLADSEPLVLPQNLFTSVRVLSLQRCPLPSWVCSANLIRSLKLVSVRLPDGDSDGRLNFSCPVLENLVLTFCGITHLKLLTLSTPLLKNLELNTAITCKTNICCPNLTAFKCSSFVRETLTFEENLPSLASADIDISPYDESGEGKTFYDNCSRNVLKGIYNVISLTLTDSFLKTMLIDHPDLLDRVPNMFHNLRYMLVKDWDCGDCIHALANVLKRLRCIETLVWERNQGSISQSKAESRVVDISCESLFHSLETFEIRNLRVVMGDLMFVKFLLARAVVLKKMIFITSWADFWDKSKLKEFKDKVLALPRASPSVSVSFILRG